MNSATETTENTEVRAGVSAFFPSLNSEAVGQERLQPIKLQCLETDLSTPNRKTMMCLMLSDLCVLCG
jgi:hypothetical protein